MREVQAVINNISFPKSLDEVLQIQDVRNGFDLEILLSECENDGCTEWTMPKWCKVGDIVFFMHAKSSKATISRLKIELRKSRDNFNHENFDMLDTSLERGRELYNQFGGKIFMIGKVYESAFYDKDVDYGFDPHWKSKIYAPIDSLFLLKNPVDISEFSSFIQLTRQSAITPVFGKEFNMLKDLIMSKNDIPSYFKDSVSTPVPLSKINRDNWIQVASKYRRSFFLEIQFRTYYVDFLLECIGDRKSFFHECSCIKKGKYTSYVDNVIVINGKYIPVEVKLNINAERDLIGQLRKYCDLDLLVLDKNGRLASTDKVFRNGVLVIDTSGIYWYRENVEYIQQICTLDGIAAKQDILNLRQQIITLMNSQYSAPAGN